MKVVNPWSDGLVFTASSISDGLSPLKTVEKTKSQEKPQGFVKNQKISQKYPLVMSK